MEDVCTEKDVWVLYGIYQKKERGKEIHEDIPKREVHGKRPVILAHAQLGCWIDHAERGSLSRALISLQQHCRPQRAEPGLCITRPKTQQQAALYMYSLYLLARRENRRQIPSIKATDPSQSKRGRCGVWWGSKRHSVVVVERSVERRSYPPASGPRQLLDAAVASHKSLKRGAAALPAYHIGSPFIRQSLSLSLSTLSARQ